MVKGDDLQERLVEFAVLIINLCCMLPKSQASQHVGSQLLRSGTSPAPNYAEGRGAESRNDFVHKLKISLKELNETAVWLRILEKSRMLSAEELAVAHRECGELSRILGASVRTASHKKSNE